MHAHARLSVEVQGGDTNVHICVCASTCFVLCGLFRPLVSTILYRHVYACMHWHSSTHPGMEEKRCQSQ